MDNNIELVMLSETIIRDHSKDPCLRSMVNKVSKQ